MRRRETLSRRRRGSASAGSPATLGGEGLMLRGMEGGEGTPATLSVTLSSYEQIFEIRTRRMR